MRAESLGRMSPTRAQWTGCSTRTFAGMSAREREAIKDRYATRTRVFNATDPLEAKTIDVLRHYITNILPNDLKAQLVASSRELGR